MSSPDDGLSSLDLGATIRRFSGGQRLFGRYELREILGRGGMGVVWLARDEKLNRDVALKFLPELVVHDLALLDDLKRETNRCLDLTHPHIVRIHDFVDDAHSACISMEYVDGATLSALRVQRPHKVFEVEELALWIKQTCEALEYAHTRARIVHRDLKPANLMLNSKGDLKVADFGIARSLTDSMSMLTMARGTSGTVVYMSPQQLLGERASVADDIYSLGATLYELLTSKPPFYSGAIEIQIRETTAPTLTDRRLELNIASESPVPANWQETIAACLNKDPTKRPESAMEVAWRIGLGSEYERKIGPFRQPQVSGTAARVQKRGRGPLLAAALVLLLAGGLLAGWWFAVQHPKRRAESERSAKLGETEWNPEAQKQKEKTEVKAAAEKEEFDVKVKAAAAAQLAEDKRITDEAAAAAEAAEQKRKTEEKAAAAKREKDQKEEAAKNVRLAIPVDPRLKKDGDYYRFDARVYGLIDGYGTIVAEPKWTQISGCSEGLCAVKRGEKWGFIDPTGAIVVEPRWDGVGKFSEGVAVVNRGEFLKGGKFGLIDRTGATIIEPKWSSIGDFSEGLASVLPHYRPGKPGKYGSIDHTGAFIIQPNLETPPTFKEGLAEYRVGSKRGFIDKTGKVVIKPTWAVVFSFSEGRALVGRRWDGHTFQDIGFIDRSGKIVIDTKWDYYSRDFSEGFAVVVRNGKYGFIDPTGNVAIELVWDDAYNFVHGAAAVKRGNKWGLIDRNGDLLVGAEWDDVDYGSWDKTEKESAYFRFTRLLPGENKSGGKAEVVWFDSTGKQVWSSTSIAAP